MAMCIVAMMIIIQQKKKNLQCILNFPPKQPAKKPSHIFLPHRIAHSFFRFHAMLKKDKEREKAERKNARAAAYTISIPPSLY